MTGTRNAPTMRIKALASGSSGNAFLVRTERACFLVDAGLPLARLEQVLAGERVPAEQLAAAFLSHEHSDHIQAARDLSCIYRVPLIANEEVLREAKLHRLADSHVQPVGSPVTIGGVTVTTFPVPHDSAGPVGFHLAHESGTVCIATDLGEASPELSERIAGADLVILEANHDRDMLLNGRYPPYLRRRILSPLGHLSNEQTGSILARSMRRNAGDVWLAHLSENNNTPKQALATISRWLRNARLDAVQLRVLARGRPSFEWPRPVQLALFD